MTAPTMEGQQHPRLLMAQRGIPSLRGVHHQTLLRDLGLLPVNRVTAAKAGVNQPRRLCRARFTTPSSTRTIGSKPTTADSRRDSVRCADLNATIRLAWSCAVTPSCRTSVAATTNSGSTRAPIGASLPLSPNSPESSNAPRTGPPLSPTRPGPSQRNRATTRPDTAQSLFIGASR